MRLISSTPEAYHTYHFYRGDVGAMLPPKICYNQSINIFIANSKLSIIIYYTAKNRAPKFSAGLLQILCWEPGGLSSFKLSGDPCSHVAITAQKLFTHMSTAVYIQVLFIHPSDLGRLLLFRTVLASKQQQMRFEPRLSRLCVHHSTAELPCSTNLARVVTWCCVMLRWCVSHCGRLSLTVTGVWAGGADVESLRSSRYQRRESASETIHQQAHNILQSNVWAFPTWLLGEFIGGCALFLAPSASETCISLGVVIIIIPW